uniref:phosphodiester glycosidase family protein n=1 Tax=uncultured Altererythrobacter sp. TaxID=500840 RepID=UPI00261B2186|nr:phosphodiester glycosidase family protein [uncultured Altererythrobacter sp.]
MKHIIPLLAVTITLAGCELQGGEPVTRTEIGSGSETRVALRREASACEVVIFEEVPLTQCVADPTKHNISTVLTDPNGTPYRSLKTYGEALGKDAAVVAFAMNGGMFESGGKPVGYYVEEGQRLEELERGDGSGNFYLKPNGVFFGTDGAWEIRTSTNFLYNVIDRPQFGTQSGPMLVIDGQLHPEIQDDGPSKIVRNGVGIDAEGRAHFVISDGALSFGQLARYFRDELKTPNALYLDGGISGLWDPVTERLDDTNGIGPLIVVTKKASQ